MTKFLNISTDNTLGGSSASDDTVSSQKAVKDYVDSHAGGSPQWGNITGTLSNQTDLQTALNGKANDADVVKLTGDQTVAGIKTFSSELKRTATFNAVASNAITLTDNNNKGDIKQQAYYAGDIIFSRMLADNTTSGKYAYFEIQNKDSGSSNLTFNTDGTNESLSTAESSTTSKVIPTKGWVNNPSTSTNVVHRSGTEEIGGSKTFSSSLKVGTAGGSSTTGTYVSGSGSIELTPPTTASYGGFIDFHYAGSTDDYTSRIIESASGSLSINSNSFSKTSPCTVNTAPTDDNTTSKQIDTVGARNTKLDTILSTLYPVGSIYITTNATCPLATLISGSTWELVSSGRVLQGADSGHSAGTTIEAGLPNITGDNGSYRLISSNTSTDPSGTGNGLFRYVSAGSSKTGASGSNFYAISFDFDASRSNSIYGNSTTVQPPAYVVNIWKRTA